MNGEVPDAPATVISREAARLGRALEATDDLSALTHARSVERPIREGQPRRSTLDRDALHRRMLAVGDVVAAGLALNVAILAGGGTPRPWVVAVMPLVVLVNKIVGLYDRDQHLLHRTTLDEVPALFCAATVYTLVAWVLERAFVDGDLRRAYVIGLWALLTLLMVTLRAAVRRAVRTVATPERVVVVGDDAAYRRITQRVRLVHSVKAQLVGRVPLVAERRGNGTAVLGVLRDLAHVLTMHEVDRVIICPAVETSDEMTDTIRLVKSLGVKVSVVPRLFEVVGSSVEFDDLGGVTLLSLHHYGLTKSSKFLKRSLDLFGAALGLVLLAPLFAMIAAAIKLTSPGSVLFRQRRVGRAGERFELLKFRTMYDGADSEKARLRTLNESDGLFKIADDPRCTTVGRWLRRTSLDELPQLVNVVRGEMSLVGPRPLVEDEDEQIVGWHRRRLDATPGMTGVWQVLGSSRVPLGDMLVIDYIYRANWSLWLDIKILLRTVPHVLGQRGL